jgi:hypothetical protein
MSDEQRRLLELLVSAEDGCTANRVVALGFAHDLVVGVVAAGLATHTVETVLVGGQKVEVFRLRITRAGWQALWGEPCMAKGSRSHGWRSGRSM